MPTPVPQTPDATPRNNDMFPPDELRTNGMSQIDAGCHASAAAPRDFKPPPRAAALTPREPGKLPADARPLTPRIPPTEANADHAALAAPVVCGSEEAQDSEFGAPEEARIAPIPIPTHVSASLSPRHALSPCEAEHEGSTMDQASARLLRTANEVHSVYKSFAKAVSEDAFLPETETGRQCLRSAFEWHKSELTRPEEVKEFLRIGHRCIADVSSLDNVSIDDLEQKMQGAGKGQAEVNDLLKMKELFHNHSQARAQLKQHLEELQKQLDGLQSNTTQATFSKDNTPYAMDGTISKEWIKGLSSGEKMRLYERMAVTQAIQDAEQAIRLISTVRSDHDHSTWEKAAEWQLMFVEDPDLYKPHLAHFGYKLSDPRSWQAGVARPQLELQVDGHISRAGHTWYNIECKVSRMPLESGPDMMEWVAPRRLMQLRADLHHHIKAAMGPSYEDHFCESRFAKFGGPPGTTARLKAWFAVLAQCINDGIAPPSVASVTLIFLQAPMPETAAPLRNALPSLRRPRNAGEESSHSCG